MRLMEFDHHETPPASRKPENRRALSRWLPLLGAFALLAAACGGSDDNEADVAVATLEDSQVATLTDSADAAVMQDEDAPETDPEEAALAFSQCMRDEGIDFPDLAVDAEGNINLREGFENIDRDDESFREAMEACQDELAAGGFGGGRRAALDSPELQDGLVAFSDCVRDEGFDVGDLTLGQRPGAGNGAAAGDGQAANADQATEDGDDGETADGGGPAQGQREGGFGDRSARFAQQLGLDPEDPAVAEAMELCSPILDEAFTAAGVTGRGANG